MTPSSSESEIGQAALPSARSNCAPRIAMIGCGLIAERYHLPGLAGIPGVLENVVLVDRNAERLQLMSDKFGVRQQATDVDAVIGEIDGAIVAAPPALHHPICMKLLSRDIPVLCEKPLAETSAEAREMVDLARDRGVALAVNHTRRLLPAYVEVKRLLAAGAIGELVQIRWHEGFLFDWPAASAFHFRSGARGALMDTGIHSLDLICWWLGKRPSVVSSLNDSFGGPEAMAEVRLLSDHCQIELKLSWLGRLANCYEIIGSRGTISGELDYWDLVTVTHASKRRKSRRLRHTERDYNDFGATIIANFVDAVEGRAEILVPASAVVTALDVMDECYMSAARLEMPWLEYEEDACYATA